MVNINHDKKLVKAFKQLLEQKKIQVTRIAIFGSRARQSALESSDIDVFVEVKKSTSTVKKRIRNAAWEIGFANNCVMSTFIVSKAQVEGVLKMSPIMKNIDQEGIII